MNKYFLIQSYEHDEYGFRAIRIHRIVHALARREDIHRAGLCWILLTERYYLIHSEYIHTHLQQPLVPSILNEADVTVSWLEWLLYELDGRIRLPGTCLHYMRIRYDPMRFNLSYFGADHIQQLRDAGVIEEILSAVELIWAWYRDPGDIEAVILAAIKCVG